jgi:protein KTI12
VIIKHLFSIFNLAHSA